MPRNTPAPIIMPNPIMVMWNRDNSRDSSPCGFCEAGPVSSEDGLVFVAIEFLEQVSGRLLAAARGMLNDPAGPQGQADDAGERKANHYASDDDFDFTAHGLGFIRDPGVKSKGHFVPPALGPYAVKVAIGTQKHTAVAHGRGTVEVAVIAMLQYASLEGHLREDALHTPVPEDFAGRGTDA